MNELFWSASEADRVMGYIKEEELNTCLLCGFTTEHGFIYPKGDLYVDADKQMKLHIKEAHDGVFNYLLGMDKKMTGLSDHQRKILSLFYEGYSDYDVKEKLNIGSVSTIRNHRYMLKEKEKQAKTIVTIMNLLAGSMNPKNMPVKPHITATMVDSRYDTTLEESVKTLDKYFPNGTDKELKTFSMKEKYKLIILKEIVKRFDFKKRYTEKEVDLILKGVYPEDHVVLRRYLIEYGFMSRERDCSAYWRKEKIEDNKMNAKDKKTSKRKELVQAYIAKEAENKTESGVYQIKNTTNQKIFIGTARNIAKLNGLTFQLNVGSFTNKALQKEWTEYGEDGFEITVLEAFEDEDVVNPTKKLKELERHFKDSLQPYADKGYHKLLIK